MWTVEKDRLFLYKDQIRTFHHVGSTVVSKVKVANCLPVCVVVIDSLVETNETFFLQVLSADNGIILTLKVKNLWIAEVVSRVCWLVNQDLVNLCNLTLLVHQSTDLVWVTDPVFIANISCIK
ncbi:Uncharacterised protein [Streptococcus pneumoniae]|nr:Uncharacterised protein [Streptococcus pneumoniae]